MYNKLNLVVADGFVIKLKKKVFTYYCMYGLLSGVMCVYVAEVVEAEKAAGL